MIKRLITIIFALSLISANTWANEEHNITLERGDHNGKSIILPYGIISFNLEEYGNYHRVRISIENTAISQTLLLFKHSQGEKSLKKIKPKIEFEKTFPGSKGKRSVYGCKELNQSMFVIIPEDKADLLDIDVSITSPSKLELPIYLAKHIPKKLFRKEKYKILSKDSLFFNIEIKGWSENDPEYVSTKAAVEEYLHSLQSVAFCKNKRHSPSLSQQQKPYQEKKDSLVAVINKVLVEHNDWMSDMPPHIAYDELLTRLNKVDLNEYTYDCGEHKITPKRHSCSYCSLSAQQIYHQLDDIYQQLRAGKLTKDEAVKKAQGLNICYQKSTKRKKESRYTDKISKFYSRIVNY